MFDFPNLDFVPLPDDEPEKSRPPRTPTRIYTLDTETDPFQHGHYPEPFSSCVYDGENCFVTWGSDCIERMIEHIATMPPGIIYIHNGGRFDIYYYMRMIAGSTALIINGRIVRAHCQSNNPKQPHQIRDSYAIIPIPLAAYKKDEFDYKLMARDKREKHKADIIKYLKNDCIYLYELVSEFVLNFGYQITIGSAAMRELRAMHQYAPMSTMCDKEMRPLYFYGGRVQCFQKGIVRGKWKVYDVNSMYPYVMKNMLHPADMPIGDTRKILTTTCFMTVEGRNYGAFPVRTKQGLRFDVERGVFNITRHEFDAAIETEMFIPERIIRCVNFRERIAFGEFVDKFYALREDAKAKGSKAYNIFYKLILNSSYGKFAQNSEKHLDCCITDDRTVLREGGWKPYGTIEMGSRRGYIIWSRKPEVTQRINYYNVATGASITGAARSVLMRALHAAKNPVYCDTDSIICEHLPKKFLGEKELGKWKLEAQGDEVCIAGKKLYALFQSRKATALGIEHGGPAPDDAECIKQASKGVSLTAQEIKRICQGEVIESKRDAPSFHLDGTHSFITRKVRMT